MAGGDRSIFGAADMRRIAQAGCRILAGFAVAAPALILPPLLMFAGYDVLVFEPRQAQIRMLASPMMHDRRELTPLVSALVQRSYRGDVAAGAAELLIDRLQVHHVMKGEAGWQATHALWSALVSVHLSEDERVALVASGAYMGDGHYGFEAEAIARFGMPMSKLSADQAATIVALLHAPGLYQEAPAQLARRRDWLLKGLIRGAKA